MRFATYFLVILPILAAPLLLSYFIDGVLKYRFKNRRIAYIAAGVVGVVTSVAALVFCLDENGRLVMTLSYDVVSLASSLSILVLMLFDMKEKLWKKLVVFFLSDSLLDTLFLILTSFREMVYMSLQPESGLSSLVLLYVLEGSIILIEFGIFFLIDRFRSKHDNAPLPIPFLLALFLIVSLFEVFFFLQTPEYAEVLDFTRLNTAQKVTLVFTMLVGLLAIIILFYVRATKKERDTLRDMNHINEELVLSQTRYYEATVKADTEIRSIRHDMKNHVQVLKILLENKKYDEMDDYLNEMTENLKTTEISAHTGDVIADAIISSKRAEAETCGVSLSVNGVISGISITPQDMCKMLANLLDNAIEATAEARQQDLDPSFCRICLEFRRTDKFFLISTKNPCVREIKRENGMVRTSKKDFRNHGFGLKNIRTAAEKYEGELSISCKEEPYGYEFCADIMFPISSSK